MSLVNVHNEWDPLEEMIVGVAQGAQVPRPTAACSPWITASSMTTSRTFHPAPTRSS